MLCKSWRSLQLDTRSLEKEDFSLQTFEDTHGFETYIDFMIDMELYQSFWDDGSGLLIGVRRDARNVESGGKRLFPKAPHHQ